MYETNLSTHEFLYTMYVKMEQKLNRIIELINENKPYQNNNEIYETKDKLLEIINLLSLSTDDNTLINDFNTLATYIISTDVKVITQASDYCREIRFKE